MPFIFFFPFLRILWLLSKKKHLKPVNYRNNRLLNRQLVRGSINMCGHAFLKHPAGNV